MTERAKDSLSETSTERLADAITEKLRRATPIQRATAKLVAVHETKRPRSAFALILMAVVIVTIEMVRYWLLGHPLHWQPEAIAFVVGFVGFYIRNPKQTREGAMILLNGATGLIAVFRTGKRAGDVKVVEVEKPKETDPG